MLSLKWNLVATKKRNDWKQTLFVLPQQQCCCLSWVDFCADFVEKQNYFATKLLCDIRDWRRVFLLLLVKGVHCPWLLYICKGGSAPKLSWSKWFWANISNTNTNMVPIQIQSIISLLKTLGSEEENNKYNFHLFSWGTCKPWTASRRRTTAQ